MHLRTHVHTSPTLTTSSPGSSIHTGTLVYVLFTLESTQQPHRCVLRMGTERCAHLRTGAMALGHAWQGRGQHVQGDWCGGHAAPASGMACHPRRPQPQHYILRIPPPPSSLLGCGTEREDTGRKWDGMPVMRHKTINNQRLVRVSQCRSPLGLQHNYVTQPIATFQLVLFAENRKMACKFL